MKATLLSKITDLRERMPPLPSVTLSPSFIKRTAFGGLCGLILGFIISLFLSNPQTILLPQNMDSEILTLDRPASNDFDAPIPITTEQFGFFIQNKASLSDVQFNAIKNNARRFTVVIGNIGKREKTVEEVIKTFPPEVTLSLSPYTPQFNTTSKSFRDKGYEVWLSLKTQTKELNTDMGPNALSPVNDLESNIAMLDSQIKGKGYVTGIVIPQRSLILESDLLWRDLTYELFAIGYGIFDTTNISIAPTLFYHKDTSAPYIKNDFVIDNTLSKDEIKSVLNEMQAKIMKDKNAILTVTSLPPASLDILAEWINAVKAEGATLIPLSAQTQLKK